MLYKLVLHAVGLLLLRGHGLMVVESLGLQHLGQIALVPRGLLQLGPLVLEPDLDLVLVKPQLAGEKATTLLR